MQSTTLIKRSRQGDANAIAAVMNQALQPHGISVKVKVRSDRLKILLEADRVPNRQRLLPIVTQGIAAIRPSHRKVYVYGRQRGSATIAWVTAIGQNEARPLQMGPSGSAVLSTSTASLGGEPESASASALGEDWLIRQLHTEISERLATEQISGLSTVSDIEIEGHDVLVTFETREMLDSRALADMVRQAAHSVDATTLKIARLYKRHPRTQRSLPIREILLGPAAEAASRRAVAVAIPDDVVAAVAERPLASQKGKPKVRALQLGLLGLCGLSMGLALAGWISPLVVILVLGAALIVWQISAHLGQGRSSS